LEPDAGALSGSTLGANTGETTESTVGSLRTNLSPPPCAGRRPDGRHTSVEAGTTDFAGPYGHPVCQELSVGRGPVARHAELTFDRRVGADVVMRVRRCVARKGGSAHGADAGRCRQRMGWRAGQEIPDACDRPRGPSPCDHPLAG
jgi:hypothetical protein